MHKHIIVDGYNLALRSTGAGSGKSKESLRAALVRRLDALAGFLAEKITVVFDGAGRGGLDTADCTAVDIVFSNGNSSADAVIEQMVFNSPRPSDILVVTSDLAERAAVSGSGAETMAAGIFLDMLKECEARLAASAANKRRARKAPTLADIFPPEPPGTDR